jgi:hypothetical protein
VLGKHVAELSDPSAQARRLLDKIDLQPGIGQVERGAHPTNAAANNHDSSNRWTATVPVAEGRHSAPSTVLLSARLFLNSLGLFTL